MNEIQWQAFHFLRPQLLWLLIPALWLLWRWLSQPSSKDGWQQHCDPELLAAMTTQSAQKGSIWQGLYWPIVVIAILAAAGPAVRQVPVPVVQNQAALVLALDVSRSMLADDVKPSRLQRAKFKIQDLLEQRKDGQTALVAYAGEAFVVTPLTNDTETITAMLDAIEPSIMPVKGTNTARALEKSAELLSQSGLVRGEVLLITDGVAMHKTESALAQLKSQNIKTHVMAVGTEAGAPIPTPRGFVKDLQGQIVVPKVDFSDLQAAAQAGGGHFTVLTSGDDFIGMFDTERDDSDDLAQQEDMNSAEFIDDGPYLALLILPLLALMYRRGLLLCLPLTLMMPVEQAQALSWDDLWLNKDQQAWKKIHQTEAEAAIDLAQDPKLKAAAAYESKQYQQAADMYRTQVPDLDKYYNQGNALAQSGQLEQALASYEQALAIDPEDEDTLYNKKIVEDALKQQQEQQQSEQGEQGEQSDQEQQGDQQQEQQGEQQNQEQEGEQQESQEEQQAKEQAEQEQQEQGQEGEEQEQPPEPVELTPEEQALDAEEKQAMEQWLRRIKDDPGGLLRRKFLYQYHRRNQQGDDYQTTEDW